MSGYKGSATVQLHVQRIKDLDTDQYRMVQDDDDDERVEELELEVIGTSYFTPGRLSGPPEDCYPDEGETEILTVTLNSKAFLGDLSKDETQEAESLISEAVQEDDGPASEPDYDEPDYDDRDDGLYDNYD